MLSLPWIYILSSLAGGFGIGFLVYHFTNKSVQEKLELQKQLAAREVEMEDYKQKVALHLDKTSALLNTMGEEFHNLSAHLQTGTKTLMSDSANLDQIAHTAAPQAQNNIIDEPRYSAAPSAQATSKRDDLDSELDDYDYDYNNDHNLSFEDNPLDHIKDDLDSLLDDHHEHNQYNNDEDEFMDYENPKHKDYVHLEH